MYSNDPWFQEWMDIKDEWIILRMFYVTQSAPYHFTNGDLRLTGDRLRGWGWWIVDEKAAAAAAEETSQSERERETAAFALFIADIYWLGKLQSVCVWATVTARDC